MDKQNVLDNIKIARRYLDSYHMLLPDESVIFDFYNLPSYNWKAFYAQIYKHNGIYRANCACTRCVDYIGIESYSSHFAAIDSDRHKAKNDVFCKCIFPDPAIVNDLLACAMCHRQIDSAVNEHIVLDGITVGIRSFENGSISKDICLINPDDHDRLVDEILRFSETI